jgi:hypothetical protein
MLPQLVGMIVQPETLSMQRGRETLRYCFWKTTLVCDFGRRETLRFFSGGFLYAGWDPHRRALGTARRQRRLYRCGRSICSVAFHVDARIGLRLLREIFDLIELDVGHFSAAWEVTNLCQAAQRTPR